MNNATIAKVGTSISICIMLACFIRLVWIENV
jgi:hypothetical protein